MLQTRTVSGEKTNSHKLRGGFAKNAEFYFSESQTALC